MGILESLSNLKITFFDPIFLILFIIFILEESIAGVLPSFFNFVSIASAFFAALFLYPYFSFFLRNQLHFPKGLADGIAFLLIWIVVWIILNKIFQNFKKNEKRLHKFINVSGGFLFSLASFFFWSCILTSLIISLPSSTGLKNQVTESFFGRFIILRVLAIESNMRLLTGEREDMLNLLTLQFYSDRNIPLNFVSQSPLLHRESEMQIISHINFERQIYGLTPLIFDSVLTSIAQDHAEDMLQKGYFAYISPEGYTLFDRFDIEGVVYAFGTAQIALAPNADIVIDRLFNKKIYSEYLLEKRFTRIGVGVLDTDYFGKIFVIIFVY